jgi:hypothetical protein
MTRLLLPLGLGLALSACGSMPDLRPSRAGGPAGFGATPPAAPAAPAPVGPVAGFGGGAAESACVAAGRERGFDVQSVVGSVDVPGADGRPVSRDVMLRVLRGGQQFDVRCSFVYADGIARVMAL